LIGKVSSENFVSSVGILDLKYLIEGGEIKPEMIQSIT
jgi:hypothetical protein